MMAAYANNEGPSIIAETIQGNVEITSNYNKNTIVLPAPGRIPDYINFRVSQPEANFTGRTNELEKLKQISASTDAEKIVVTGMGGVGKTQLTRKFIEENQTNYENIIWIDAETEKGISDSFKKLSDDILHISTLNASGKDKYTKSIIEQVLQKLCKRKTLFVYDNVDSIQSMKFVLAIAPSPQRAKPHVLITSRLRNWRSGITIIVLTVWSPVETMKFITEILDDPHNDTEEYKMLLAETLQYFPLALRQATGYINQQRECGDFKISKYIDKYERNICGMLKSTAFQDDVTSDYNNTTYTTWSITIQAIENDKLNGQLALKVFKIIAYFKPDFIERDWFVYLTLDDEEERDERIKSAVALLLKYCMVDSQDNQESVEVHRLVQQVTKFKLKESHEEESVLREALQLISNIDVKHVLSAIGPHAISVFLSALSYPDLVKEFSSLSLKILEDVLFFSTDKTKQFGDTVVEPLTNILGENDRVLLRFRYYIARSYQETGLNDRALQMNLEVYEKQTSNFGECDLDTLQTQCQIANLYHRLGNANASLHLYEEALKIQRECLGEDHPDTVQTKSDLAFHSRIVGEVNSITEFMKREGLL